MSLMPKKTAKASSSTQKQLDSDKGSVRDATISVMHHAETIPATESDRDRLRELSERNEKAIEALEASQNLIAKIANDMITQLQRHRATFNKLREDEESDKQLLAKHENAAKALTNIVKTMLAPHIEKMKHVMSIQAQQNAAITTLEHHHRVTRNNLMEHLRVQRLFNPNFTHALGIPGPHLAAQNAGIAAAAAPADAPAPPLHESDSEDEKGKNKDDSEEESNSSSSSSTNSSKKLKEKAAKKKKKTVAAAAAAKKAAAKKKNKPPLPTTPVAPPVSNSSTAVFPSPSHTLLRQPNVRQ